jgi:hypothetical protein
LASTAREPPPPLPTFQAILWGAAGGEVLPTHPPTQMWTHLTRAGQNRALCCSRSLA